MKKSFNPIVINETKGIYTTEVSQKPQVEIRQEVKVSYPSAKLGSSLADQLFTNQEAGVSEQVFTDNRVTWLPVGNISDIDAVRTKLESLPNARIYKILSLKPILTDNDESAITSGMTTIENIAAKQRVRNKEGQIKDYNGLPQYRRLAFSAEGIEDIDYRAEQFAEMKVESIGIQKTVMVENKETVNM